MQDNAELLERFCNGDEQAMPKLVKNNMGLVYSVVSKLENRMYDKEDLVQIGSMGLVKAIRKFDTSFGVQFSTYAIPMIIGEIKRFLRDDGTIKVSRSIKETAMKGRRCMEILEKRLGRTPTVNEISAECGILPEQLIEAFEASAPPQSLQEQVLDGEDGLCLMGLIAGEDNENEIVDRLFVRQMLGQLNERERKIIIMRYFRGKTQSEVSKEVGVSQVQISRLEKKALQKMRDFAVDDCCVCKKMTE